LTGSMDSPAIIRVAAPLADGLLHAGLAKPIPSETRAGALELAVDASIVIKDVASVVLAVAAGERGIRAALDWLRRTGADADVVVTIHSPGVERSWTLERGHIDDLTVEEVAGALSSLATVADDDGSMPTERP
jgi:hypothetical protein